MVIADIPDKINNFSLFFILIAKKQGMSGFPDIPCQTFYIRSLFKFSTRKFDIEAFYNKSGS